MEFKIAVASSDGRRVDTPFGKAEQLYIYESMKPGTYLLRECRRLRPGDLTPEEGAVTDAGHCGCGVGANCCSGDGESIKLQVIEDCRFFLCSHIGLRARKTLERHAITVFEIDEAVNTAIEKIVRFYNRS